MRRCSPALLRRRTICLKIPLAGGGVAQLGERILRKDEVGSSILLASTNSQTALSLVTSPRKEARDDAPTARLSVLTAALGLASPRRQLTRSRQCRLDKSKRQFSRFDALGNGVIGLNVWVEGGGDLLCYLARPDALECLQPADETWSAANPPRAQPLRRRSAPSNRN